MDRRLDIKTAIVQDRAAWLRQAQDARDQLDPYATPGMSLRIWGHERGDPMIGHQDPGSPTYDFGRGPEPVWYEFAAEWSPAPGRWPLRVWCCATGPLTALRKMRRAFPPERGTHLVGLTWNPCAPISCGTSLVPRSPRHPLTTWQRAEQDPDGWDEPSNGYDVP